jgi:hypothetical protein
LRGSGGIFRKSKLVGWIVESRDSSGVGLDE